MAIYDVNAAIDKPNMWGAFQQGRAQAMQLRQDQMAVQAQQQQAQDRNALRQLAPQIIAGDPGAFDQAAAINPEAAGQYQSAGDQQLKRLKGAMDFIDRMQTPEQKEMAYQQVRPYLNRMSPDGVEPPATFAEAAPKMEAARARIAMLVNDPTQTPTGFRQFQMTAEAAGLKPGTPEYQQAARIALGQEGRASSAGYGFEMVEGADGRKRLQRRDPRTGVVEVYDETTQGLVPFGAPAAAPTDSGVPITAGGLLDPTKDFQQLAAIDGVQPTSFFRDPANNRRVGGVADSQHMHGTAGDFVVPAAQRPAFIQQARSMGYEAIDEGDHVHVELPPGGRAGGRFTPANPSLVVGRRAEDEAAAVEAAKTRTQLDYLPQELGMRTSAAIEEARGKGQLEAAQETAQAAPGAISTMQQSLDSIDALIADPNLGDIVGVGSLNPLNRLPGSAARGLIARAEQISGQAFLAAFNQLKGGGAITEREGAAATAAMARLDRSQGLEDYRSALTDLKRAIEPALQRQRASLGRAQRTMGIGGGAPARRIRNPQTGETMVLRNGQWVRE